MRRHTGAAGIAVAIAAIVPLADTAHAEGPEPRSPIHQEAARSALTDPGVPEPLSPDASYQDSSDEGPLESGGAGQGPYEGDPLDQGEFSPDTYEQDGSGQGGFEQGGSGQGGFEQGGSEQGGSEQGGSEQGGSEQGGVDDGRLDEASLDGGGLGQARPGGDRPEQSGLDAGRTGQGVLDERREPYEGAVAAAPQHWASDPTISATSKPRPTPTTPAPAATTPAPATSAPAASPTVMPTLGTQGGVGGASATGPSGEDIAIGLGGVASAALAAGYALLRRRRNG